MKFDSTLRAETVKELTHNLIKKFYQDNDLEYIIDKFDVDLSWFGAGEHEYSFNHNAIVNTFESFKGKVPACIVAEEEYHVQQIDDNSYLCTGRYWVSTDPSTGIFLRQHQRITTVFSFTDKEPSCKHIHISNPYTEMVDSDIGFPVKFSQQSYEYMQHHINKQRKYIEDQAALLSHLSNIDTMTGLLNRNRFNQLLEEYKSYPDKTRLGVFYLDLNGLKTLNDSCGHLAGDDLIRRTSGHLKEVFHDHAYRIGGDEFVVIYLHIDENDFYKLIDEASSALSTDNISFASGISWRESDCDLDKQCEEADRKMYEEKAVYYKNLIAKKI